MLLFLERDERCLLRDSFNPLGLGKICHLYLALSCTQGYSHLSPSGYDAEKKSDFDTIITLNRPTVAHHLLRHNRKP
jgi:hypothetical protein